MPIQLFSFFSGVGFLDLGFQNANFDIAFVEECNNRYLQAYKYARRNNPHTPRYGYSNLDIRCFLDDDIWNNTFPDYRQNDEELIGFIGGPPCPDFSIAGKNRGATGENGQLTSVYANLIIKRQPDFFVFENVRGLYKTKKHKDFYDHIKRRLYRAGYSLFDTIENSLSYGVPQFRERLILIGFKRTRFGNRLNYEFGSQRIYSMNTVNNIYWPTVTPYIENSVLELPQNIIAELTVEYWFEQNDVNNHPNSEDVFKVVKQEKFNTVCEGDTSRKSSKRLHRWRYSPTAAYGNNEVHLHPYLPRRINVAEAMAIQSLPPTFELPTDLSLSDKFKMVGNGVPYLLALGIATELHDWIDEKIGD